MDLSVLLKRAETDGGKIHFDPADVYDFKLETTADLRVLEKKAENSVENGGPRSDKPGGLLYTTALWARCLARR